MDKDKQQSGAGLSYRDAGVDIDAGDALIERIKPYAKRTQRPEVMGSLGGFGALCQIPLDRYKEPVLVSGTDGVGTKLKLAMQMHKHDTIGVDLVAMCVNDLVVQGAEPLFFLDYYATGHLDVDVAADVIKGIAAGCEQAGCALIGGETAELALAAALDDCFRFAPLAEKDSRRPILLIGPPGAGKPLLARTIPSLLTDLDDAAALAATVEDLRSLPAVREVTSLMRVEQA